MKNRTITRKQFKLEQDYIEKLFTQLKNHDIDSMYSSIIQFGLYVKQQDGVVIEDDTLRDTICEHADTINTVCHRSQLFDDEFDISDYLITFREGIDEYDRTNYEEMTFKQYCQQEMDMEIECHNHMEEIYDSSEDDCDSHYY